MIKLSKKWNYWLKAIVYLSKQDKDIVKISEISSNLWISENFLRRIIVDFEKAWIVKTIKGRNGWVTLWKKANSIFLYDIFLSLWEPLNITDCTAWVFCKDEGNCVTTDILKKLQKSFNTILKMQSIENITRK